MFKDIIKLINITITTNAIGDMEEIEIQRQVFANKKSIRQSEYYQALSNGLKPSVTFETYTFEYESEKTLLYNDIKYRIIRTFEKGDRIELICEGVI